MSLFRRRPSPSPVLQGNRHHYDDPELELVRPPRYVELDIATFTAVTYDPVPCSRDEACVHPSPPALLGIIGPGTDGWYGADWRNPWLPVDAHPLDTRLWVCEDCACELEET